MSLTRRLITTIALAFFTVPKRELMDIEAARDMLAWPHSGFLLAFSCKCMTPSRGVGVRVRGPGNDGPY